MSRRLALAVLLLATACGESARAPAPDAGLEQDADTPRTPNGKRCDDETRLGEFRIAPSRGYANISGQVSSAVVPSVELTVVGEADGCQLIKKKNPFCDPPCSGGDVCTPAGQCEEEPHSLNLGTVSVRGLATPVNMEPAQPGNVYFDTNVPEDGVPVEAALRLTSEGGELVALDLVGTGPAPLEVTSEDVTVQRDHGVALAWKVPAKGAGLVRITLNVDQHGNSPVSLTCDVEDDGAHTIPKALVNQLLDAGVSGFPTAFVARESVDSTELARGCVEFVVRYQVQRSVSVVGHTPCTRNEECASGHCDLATETCVAD